MYNLNVSLGGGGPPPPSLLSVIDSGLCSNTPKTPEILNSVIAMTSPLEYTYIGGQQYQQQHPLQQQQLPNHLQQLQHHQHQQQMLLSDSHSSCSGSPLDSPAGSTAPPSIKQTCSQLIKAGLKLSLESKRKLSSGDSSETELSKIAKREYMMDSSDDDDDMETNSPKFGLTPEDEDRRRRRRERNKIAATKCRMKKRERTLNLVSESESLESQNVSMKNQVRSLELERRELTEMLQAHSCLKQDGYQLPIHCTISVSKYLGDLSSTDQNGTQQPQTQQQQQQQSQTQTHSQQQKPIPSMNTIKFSQNLKRKQQQHQMLQSQQPQSQHLTDIGFCNKNGINGTHLLSSPASSPNDILSGSTTKTTSSSSSSTLSSSSTTPSSLSSLSSSSSSSSSPQTISTIAPATIITSSSTTTTQIMTNIYCKGSPTSPTNDLYGQISSPDSGFIKSPVEINHGFNNSVNGINNNNNNNRINTNNCNSNNILVNDFNSIITNKSEYIPNCENNQNVGLINVGGDVLDDLGIDIVTATGNTILTNDFVLKSELIDAHSPYTTVQSADRFLFDDSDNFIDSDITNQSLKHSNIHNNNNNNNCININNNNTITINNHNIDNINNHIINNNIINNNNHNNNNNNNNHHHLHNNIDINIINNNNINNNNNNTTAIIEFSSNSNCSNFDTSLLKSDFLSHNSEFLTLTDGSETQFTDLDSGVTTYTNMANGGCLA